MRLKLLTTLILSFTFSATALAVSVNDPVQTSFGTNPFPDTDISVPEGVASAELQRRGVIGGYPDGTFGGYNYVNRAEAAKFLMLAKYGNSGVSSSTASRFPDTPSGQWYIPYVNKTAELGIINGYPDGTFKPGNTINTAEFLKMITLTFGLETNLSYTYRDVKTSDWFSVYAGAVLKYNLFPHRSSDWLYPEREMSRYEVAVAIYNVMKEKYGTEFSAITDQYSYKKRDYNVEILTKDLKERLNLVNRANEKILPMMAVSNGNHYSVIPKGYEELGKAYVNDLIYCNSLLDDFFGFPFPKQYMVVKIYESNNEISGGVMGNGILYYSKTASLLNGDLNDVINMNKSGFLYRSGPTYCSNTHELTHAYFDEWGTTIPIFINEGLAEYTQAMNQVGSKDYYECGNNGYYIYENGEKKLMQYQDLFPFTVDELHYNTSKCLIEELIKTYKGEDFIKDFTKRLKENPFVYSNKGDYFLEQNEHFINTVLTPLYSVSISSLLDKYGISKNEYLLK